MPGTAVVVIKDKQWSVNVATTPSELTTGLSGVASIPAGTGMLFDLGAEQIITVTAEEMLFPTDVIFIDSNLLVTEVAFGLMPGDFGVTSLPARYFLEVNAGEAEGILGGDAVSITITQAPGFDWSSIINFAMPLVVLGLVFPLITGMMKSTSGSSHSSNPVRRLGKPRTEGERARVHEEFYGTKELPPRGMGLKERGELSEGRRLGEPKTREERGETHKGLYGSSELPERGEGLHHSIHGPERQKLVDQYGSWGVGRAESVCREGDVECVEREAARLLGAYRRGFGV